MKPLLLAATALCLAYPAQAQEDSVIMQRIASQVLNKGKCYEDLRVLCKKVGHRISGSPEAEKAVQWGYNTMKAAGFDKVWLQPVTVPVWIRGRNVCP